MVELTPDLQERINYAMFRKLLPRLKTHLYATADSILATADRERQYTNCEREALVEHLMSQLVEFMVSDTPAAIIPAQCLDDRDYLQAWFDIDDLSKSFRRNNSRS